MYFAAMFVKDLMNPLMLVIGVLLLAMSWKIKCYTLSNDDMRRFQNKAYIGTQVVDGKPAGVIIGKWFIGWTNSPERGRCTMKVFSLVSSHDLICKVFNEVVRDNESPKKFSRYYRDGGFDNLYYPRNPVDITLNGERPFQTTVIDKIVDIFGKKDNAVVLLAGPPGCGKSAVYKQLIRRLSTTKKMKCSFTNEYRMCDPGDKFSSLYSTVSPDDESPLIVLLDEIDGVLKRIGGNGILQHLKFPIEVKNKTEWNSFFDGVDSGFYKNTIFLLTTNLTLAQIDDIDPSYTRGGRCDARFDVNSSNEVLVEIYTPPPIIVDALTPSSSKSKSKSPFEN
jgi:hypothetical protein